MPKKDLESLSPEERIHECFEAAVKYIAVSPRSEKEVKEKLYGKGFHRNEVEDAIDRCKGYRYIDDEAYVRSYIDYYCAKLGRKMIAYKLTNDKGINATLASNLIADLISDEDELSKCSDMAAAYIAKKRIKERKDFNKVSAYLYGKGFEFDVINKTLNAFNLDEND